MPEISAVCVYCASSTGHDPAYGAAADAVGAALAAEGIRLVYGGGRVGLMGRVADAALAAGGEVVGVIPRGLFEREVEHRGVTELHEVGSMHERKQLMFDLSDAFVALPGGFGTLEELAEVTTWGQLGIHQKPVAVLDLLGFWQPLLAWISHAVELGLIRDRHRDLITPVGAVEDLLPALRAYRSEPVRKWLDLDQT